MANLIPTKQEILVLDYDTKKLNSESCRVTSLDKFVKLLGGNPYHIKQREFEEKFDSDSVGWYALK